MKKSSKTSIHVGEDLAAQMQKVPETNWSKVLRIAILDFVLNHHRIPEMKAAIMAASPGNSAVRLMAENLSPEEVISVYRSIEHLNKE